MLFIHSYLVFMPLHVIGRQIIIIFYSFWRSFEQSWRLTMEDATRADQQLLAQPNRPLGDLVSITHNNVSRDEHASVRAFASVGRVAFSWRYGMKDYVPKGCIWLLLSSWVHTSSTRCEYMWPGHRPPIRDTEGKGQWPCQDIIYRFLLWLSEIQFLR